MIYGLAFANQLGLLDGITAYYFGNMEEWNDGSAPHAFVETEDIKPDYVVIGEPTELKIYRGQKGRVEMKVVAKGKSAHAASNHLGDNAIYKLLPIIDGIANMQPQLGDHEFLGPGRITVTDMDIQTPSINAVPNEATIFIDRRTTWGETTEGVVEQVKGLIGDRSDMSIGVLMYDKPSYTGFVFPLEKVYPAWLVEEDHPFVQAGLETLKALGRPAESGKWNFSTNGIYWAGKAGIPSIGYGPGQEEHAHTVLDQVSLEDVVQSTAFYALLPSFVRKL